MTQTITYYQLLRLGAKEKAIKTHEANRLMSTKAKETFIEMFELPTNEIPHGKGNITIIECTSKKALKYLREFTRSDEFKAFTQK